MHEMDMTNRKQEEETELIRQVRPSLYTVIRANVKRDATWFRITGKFAAILYQFSVGLIYLFIFEIYQGIQDEEHYSPTIYLDNLSEHNI